MNIKQQKIFLEENVLFFKTKNSKRLIRHNFFNNINTEIQAYLLGFYAADGNVNLKRKTLRIHISKKDIEIINLYQEYICPEANIYIANPCKINGRNNIEYICKESISIDINSSIIVNTLINLGYGCRKTFLEFGLPKLDKDLIIHFIRGYFDGDGCITGWISKELGKQDRFRCSFDICSNTENILKEIKEFLYKNEIIVNINYIKRDNMYRLKTSSKKELKKIFNLLYKNSNFYLNRKYLKFNQYVNSEVTCNQQEP